MNETEEGCGGPRREKEGGGSAEKYKNNLLLHMGQKSRDDLFKTGCYPSFLSHLPHPPPLPPPPLCSTCLSERSEKLETAQLTIFSLGDQRHCGLTLKLKIQISMYSEMGAVCVTARRREQVCQLEVTQAGERVQSGSQLSLSHQNTASHTRSESSRI